MLERIEITARDDGSAEILIYDQIGDSFWAEGLTAKQFAKDIKKLGPIENIDVRINSPGGSVFEGLAIYNQLKQHPAKVHVKIDGVALSMASVIAMAGDDIEMAENGLMMLHNPRGAVSGESKDMRRIAMMMDKAREGMIKAYVDKSGSDREEIEALIDAETWLDSADALSVGLIDSVSGDVAMAAHFDMPDGLRVPAHVSGHLNDLWEPKAKPKHSEGARQMAQSTKEQPIVDEPKGPQPATLKELKTLSGLDVLGDAASDFVLSQLDEDATLAEAQGALNAKMAELIKAKNDEIETVKKKSAEVVNHGVEALSTASPGAETKPEALTNPKETYAELLRTARQQAKANGEEWDAVRASQKIRRERPELFEAMGVKASGQFWS